MSNSYLPDVYVRFRERFSGVSPALDTLGASVDGAGPLDERTRRLVKLGIAAGTGSAGAVRSNARRALQAGATKEEVLHVVALTITTAGFPAAVAAFSWVDDVLSSER
jgi:alkylhydroperoxidase/carboxymuconolactone decarboxylase family protein YurZ